MFKLQKHKYLIIGGTSKAATTSLFYYFTDHPQINPSTKKETRFFIDENYPIPSFGATLSDGLAKYDTFFKTESDLDIVRMEASPDYLYSANTPWKIKQSLPNAKVVFILREPISRLVSWYKFAQQRTCLPKEMTFQDYVEKQLHEEPSTDQFGKETKQKNSAKSAQRAYFFSMLQQGCYSNYLRPYIETLGRQNIYVVFYEDLCSDPHTVVKGVCDFAAIDSTFYEQYEFKVFNRTQKMRNPQLHGKYEKIRTDIRQYTHNLPIHGILRKMKTGLDPLYYRINAATADKDEILISSATQTKLKNYYQSEKNTLENLLNCSIPWHD